MDQAHQANWITLVASAVALLSVIVSFLSVVVALWTNKRQLQNTTILALKQIEASGREASKKLRAEILITQKQAWLKEFRDTINEILFFADPDLDGKAEYPLAKRVQSLIRLCHKVDLMLPIGEEHARLTLANTKAIVLLQNNGHSAERLDNLNEITKMVRQILTNEQKHVEADF